jgi:hypothetical protein
VSHLLVAHYTDADGASSELAGDTLAELAAGLPADYDGPSITVRDDHGFTRGWVRTPADWRAW